MKQKLLAFMLLLTTAGTCAAAKTAHNALFFTPASIQQAKQRVATDTTYARCWNDICATADQLLTKNDLLKMDYLALAYQMTDSTKYADKLKDMLLRAVQAKTWGNSEMLARTPVWNSELNIAHRSFACALAYDAVYGQLTTAERKTIAQGLKRLAIDPALNDWLLEPTRIHALNSMGHNWWTSCVCMAGVLAMSLQNEIPEAATWATEIDRVLPQWFAFAGDDVQQKPRTFDRAGGMYESLNYATFGISEALLFRLGYLHACGKQPTDIPQLKLLPNFFLQVCYPRTGILYNINFGDSHKNVSAENSMILLSALGIGQQEALWYCQQVTEGQHREGASRNRPFGFLYMPYGASAPTPALPTAQLWSDFGWSTMRTSWQKDATMLAVKSGYTWNHSHADANSFILFHKGVDIIKDAGNCTYSKPEYRNYFFQSQAHNVVLVDGEGQPREQQYQGSPLRGTLSHQINTSNLKYIMANGTGPMADKLMRNYRHFLWLDSVIYVVDDIKAYQQRQFSWLWHFNGEVKKRGADVHVTNGQAAIVVRPLYPRMLALSDFVHDYPEDLYMESYDAPTEDLKGTEKYYAFCLPQKTDRVKALTAIMLQASPTQNDLPQIERREGKDWIGLRIRKNGKITDLYINQLADGRLMHMNSWIEADGWTTDAYMLALQYAEGGNPAQPTELFIAYGSSLRRGTETYFTSLSKLFAVQTQNGSTAQLWIDGQPIVDALFRYAQKPATTELNGQTVATEYKNNMLHIYHADANK